MKTKKTSAKTNIKIGIFLLIILAVLISVSTFSPVVEPSLPSLERTENAGKFWKYQCFDTMKTSRDKARAWKDESDLEEKIDKEMQSIVELGGNCVAIATPYDEEFLPYLQKWVASAREHNLHIWFRGNFSSWEGWFDYPKGMTTAEHNRKTKEFITDNVDLFEDGDIFTPSPEAENGGPFNQVEQNEHQTFRNYLIEEYQTANDAFAEIDKDVEVNWLSMNGGLARRMFDQKTIDGVGGVVTIDHYIKTAPEMGEFISYFKNNFGAKLVIGEFGAPIPDINGPMNEEEQAEFVDKLFEQLTMYKNDVYAINYWTLWDGSAALYNPDWTPRKAVEVVKKYMHPGLVTGRVVSTNNEPVANAQVKTSDNKYRATTGKDGIYELLLPEGTYRIEVSHSDYTAQTGEITLTRGTTEQAAFALIPKDPSLWYNLKTTIHDLRKSMLK